MTLDDLEQRKAMLAAIIDSSEDAIISKDLQSRITSWNIAAERMFGYKESEVIGKNIHILIPHDRLSEEEMIITSLKAGRRIEHYQTVRVSKSGREIPISLTISPIKNSKGEIIGASKIVRDITRQKEDEEKIRKYTRQLEVINFVGKKIVSKLDENTILQTVTDATTELSGAAFGAFFFNKIDAKGEAYMLFALSGAPREAFEKFGMPRNTKVFEPTFSGTGIVRSGDITKDARYGKNSPHFGMPKGHLPVVSYLAVPVVSHANVVIGGLFYGHPKPDMFTEEHEQLVSALAAQAAIALDNAKLYEEIQLMNSKKDEFIGFASHELKTPLTTIKGYIQYAQKEPTLLTELAPKLSRQVDRLEGIISDLLDISRIQAGKLLMNYSKVSLDKLVKESIDTIANEEHIIEYELPTELQVNVDQQKMTQVFVNLLSNAAKYSPQGSTITFKAMQLGDEVKISISDQGIGVSPENLEKIFNQFYRVSSGETQTPGVGLGLYISKEIIEKHQGRIWAESEIGIGSTFFIEFPVENKSISRSAN